MGTSSRAVFGLLFVIISHVLLLYVCLSYSCNIWILWKSKKLGLAWDVNENNSNFKRFSRQMPHLLFEVKQVKNCTFRGSFFIGINSPALANRLPQAWSGGKRMDKMINLIVFCHCISFFIYTSDQNQLSNPPSLLNTHSHRQYKPIKVSVCLPQSYFKLESWYIHFFLYFQICLYFFSNYIKSVAEMGGWFLAHYSSLVKCKTVPQVRLLNIWNSSTCWGLRYSFSCV